MSGTGRMRQSLWDRWAAKVDMSGGLDACWPWRGAKSHKRRGKRGVIQVGGRGSRVVSAARVALALVADGDYDKRDAHGQLLEVLHACGNGGNHIDCVNPRHLRWGTRTENEQDKRGTSCCLEAFR